MNSAVVQNTCRRLGHVHIEVPGGKGLAELGDVVGRDLARVDPKHGLSGHAYIGCGQHAHPNAAVLAIAERAADFVLGR